MEVIAFVYFYTTLHNVLALMFSTVNDIKNNPRQQAQQSSKEKPSHFTFQCMKLQSPSLQQSIKVSKDKCVS